MRKIFFFILIFLLSFNLFASFSYVEDRAGLFDKEEKKELESLFEKASDESNMTLALLTDITTGGIGEERYSDDYFDYTIGSEDGVLLFINMKERIVYISTKGYGMYAVDDSGEEMVFDIILPYLSSGDYYSGALYFLRTVSELSRDYPKSDYLNTSYNLDTGIFETNAVKEDKLDWAICVFFFILFGLASGFIYTARLKRKLRSEGLIRDAETYVVPNSFSLDSKKDLYLFSTVSKVPRVQNNSSKGGSSFHSSSGHISSSGSIHGGGGRRF